MSTSKRGSVTLPGLKHIGAMFLDSDGKVLGSLDTCPNIVQLSLSELYLPDFLYFCGENYRHKENDVRRQNGKAYAIFRPY